MCGRSIDCANDRSSDSAHFNRASAVGVAVRTGRPSYRARLRTDLSCVAEAQIFYNCHLNIYLSGIRDIFRFRRERQAGIARAVPWARHHRCFECRNHTRMGVAEVFLLLLFSGFSVASE